MLQVPAILVPRIDHLRHFQGKEGKMLSSGVCGGVQEGFIFHQGPSLAEGKWQRLGATLGAQRHVYISPTWKSYKDQQWTWHRATGWQTVCVEMRGNSHADNGWEIRQLATPQEFVELRQRDVKNGKEEKKTKICLGKEQKKSSVNASSEMHDTPDGWTISKDFTLMSKCVSCLVCVRQCAYKMAPRVEACGGILGSSCYLLCVHPRRGNRIHVEDIKSINDTSHKKENLPTTTHIDWCSFAI